MGAQGTPRLHTANPSPLTGFNRLVGAVYSLSLISLFYRHIVNLLATSTTTNPTSFFTTLTLLFSDLVLAFMWLSSQAIRMRPVFRKQAPEELEKVVEASQFPDLDVFICTADPYKEPPMGVVDSALSVMAYDYPPEKISMYVSDDGGSALTLFAFMEAARFAGEWLPFCRENDVLERSPSAYFGSRYRLSAETERIKLLYENMKVRVESVVEKGKVCDEYISGDEEREAFNKWNENFTRQNHPTVIQVLLDKKRDEDKRGLVMPSLFYVSREKRSSSHHNFKAGALNVLLGFRYGSLVEDLFTGYTLKCEGWRSIFCNPKRAAFLGDAPISLIDTLNQQKRWCVGLLEVGFSSYSPLTYGIKKLGLLGLSYAHYTFWPFFSIPITVYSFLPQLALLNKVSIFPKVSDTWFLLYVFLTSAAYSMDYLEFHLMDGTLRSWWNDQRIWIIRGLSCQLYGTIDYLLKSFGISTPGFNVTSKVSEEEKAKRYEKGIMEFGVHSPIFVPLVMAALVNLASLIFGAFIIFEGAGNWEGLVMQVIISGFGVLYGWPVYEAMVLRIDGGKLSAKTSMVAAFLAFGLYMLASLLMK